MKKINWRAFTSLYIGFSFIIIIVSGIILYIAPPGRIAKWTYISLLGLEKGQWQAIHIIFTFLFVFAGGLHLYYNWQCFLGYFRNRITRQLSMKKELLLSLFVTLVIFSLILLNIPPFRAIIDFGESISESWNDARFQAPVPHAEDLTLAELAGLLDEPEEVLVSTLRTNNIKSVNSKIRLKDLARKNDRTPRELYQILRPGKGNIHSTNKNYSGRGWGRKTIRQLCAENNINEARALRKLLSRGLQANYNSTVKELAMESNMRPSQIVDIIISE